MSFDVVIEALLIKILVKYRLSYHLNLNTPFMPNVAGKKPLDKLSVVNKLF